MEFRIWSEAINMFKIGKVLNYYDKLGVAIVELDGILSVGDNIKFVHDGENIFEQTVESIQIDHQKVDSANKADIVSLKTKQNVETSSEVYKT